jgi:nitrite reductase/ring-hydroxylating ferredoxin subunit
MAGKENFYRAAELSEFAENQPLRKEINGWHLLLIHEEGSLYAFRNLCPHVGVRMNAARVKDGALICPNHHAHFDLSTGRCRESLLPGILDGLPSLTQFAIRLTDGWVEVAVPQPPRRR